jgi:hypothetical protein
LGVDRDCQSVAAGAPPTQLIGTAVALPVMRRFPATALDTFARGRIHDDTPNESGIPSYGSKSACMIDRPCRRRVSDEKSRFDAGTS